MNRPVQLARNGAPLALSPSKTRKHFILLICCVSLFMNYLDSTILNVALPTLQHAFNADEAALQWIVDSFLLVLTCLLILAGSLADRLGSRRILVTGLAIFVIGSYGCSVSGDIVQLVFARMLAGVGGAMLVPTTLSILRNTFTNRKDLARAIGIWSGVYGIACACGPLIGGVLIDNTGWRSIFLVNIPVGLIGIVFALIFIPDFVSDRPRAIDLKGQVLLVIVLGLLISSIIEAPNYGWTSPSIILGFVATALTFLLFLRVEGRQAEPLLEVRFFSNRAFAGTNVLAVITFILMSGFLFLNTMYLQLVRGFSAFRAGLFTLPLMVAIAICAPISGRYLSAHGPKMAMITSAPLAMSANIMLLFTGPSTRVWYLFIAYVLLGGSLGVVNRTITHTSVASMPAEQAGVASAITSTSRQIGSALGVAVLGSVVVTSLHHEIIPRLTKLQLSTILQARVARSGIGALSQHFGRSTYPIHQVADASYSAALHSAWWIGVALCGVWFLVARNTTTAAALEQAHASGDDRYQER